VVGLKPTYGRVSRYGLVAFGSSVDQVSPFGRTVRDAALGLTAIAGHDPRDSTCADRPTEDWMSACDADIDGRTIGLPEQCWGQGTDPLVRQRVEEALEHLQSRGVTVRPVSIPSLQLANAVYYVLTSAEASSNLCRFDGVRYGPREPSEDLADHYLSTRSTRFGPEVQRRILLGSFALSAGYAEAYYHRAQSVRDLLRQELQRALCEVDALVTPTSPTTAFPLGERTEDPLSMYLSDVFTVPASLAGLPALSVPCGLARHLPVGLQLVGRAFDEASLLGLASHIEDCCGLLQAPQ
jgi:aspartyl-tRNA(Asn)/glutamyl-tRNA(Gln) amidotransferase subunit A